ncbi:MAG: HAD family hydrolase [Candidatus Nezhaarchaeales archaeon]
MSTCILVDLGGTLIYGPRIREVFDYTLKSENLKSKFGDHLAMKLKSEFNKVYDGMKIIKKKLMIEVSLKTMLKIVLEKVLTSNASLLEEFRETFVKQYVETRMAYYDAIAFLKELKGLGFTVVVVSNSPDHSMAFGSLEKLGLLNYVDNVLTSAKIGVRKPHPLVYLMALKLSRASKALFIGDNVEADVLGPLSVGIPAIHVARNGVKLKRSVSNLFDAFDIILAEFA